MGEREEGEGGRGEPLFFSPSPSIPWKKEEEEEGERRGRDCEGREEHILMQRCCSG